jgi:hypothetical protein
MIFQKNRLIFLLILVSLTSSAKLYCMENNAFSTKNIAWGAAAGIIGRILYEEMVRNECTKKQAILCAALAGLGTIYANTSDLINAKKENREQTLKLLVGQSISGILTSILGPKAFIFIKDNMRDFTSLIPSIKITIN